MSGGKCPRDKSPVPLTTASDPDHPRSSVPVLLSAVTTLRSSRWSRALTITLTLPSVPLHQVQLPSLVPWNMAGHLCPVSSPFSMLQLEMGVPWTLLHLPLQL